jgi:hypothetical protein
MWLFHTVTLLTELSHGNANRPRVALARGATLLFGSTARFTFGFKVEHVLSGSYVVLSRASRS